MPARVQPSVTLRHSFAGSSTACSMSLFPPPVYYRVPALLTPTGSQTRWPSAPQCAKESNVVYKHRALTHALMRERGVVACHTYLDNRDCEFDGLSHCLQIGCCIHLPRTSNMKRTDFGQDTLSQSANIGGVHSFRISTAGSVALLSWQHLQVGPLTNGR